MQVRYAGAFFITLSRCCHDIVSLLIAWLNELIFLFDTEYLIFREFEIGNFTETYLESRASGGAL